ncbi:MAG: TCP-1/cpn60 chaperonin family protein [Nostoc sp. ZfuVER08]|nr:TCP-1/cpn60 chaperonin family protein [Nostoc sp. ZfuVER08]
MTINIKQIATDAAEGDEEIGALLEKAYEQVGLKGVVAIQESQESNISYVDVVEGMEFNEGYISHEFITDPEKKIAKLENPYILLYDRKISYEENLSFLANIKQTIWEEGGSLLIIAEDVTHNALTALEEQKQKGLLKNAAVKNPGYNKNTKAILQDIATLTGGTVISKDLGLKLENVTVEELGTAILINIDEDNTTIVDAKGEISAIQGRVDFLRQQIEDSVNDEEKKELQERVQKLAGGVAVVYVSAPSKQELAVRMKRAENALHATKSAIKESQ